MNFEEKEGLKQFYLKLMGFFVSFGLISGDKWEQKSKLPLQGRTTVSFFSRWWIRSMHFEQMLVQPLEGIGFPLSSRSASLSKCQTNRSTVLFLTSKCRLVTKTGFLERFVK